MILFADIILHPGGIVAWLVVGLLAGWSAGFVMKGGRLRPYRRYRRGPCRGSDRRIPLWFIRFR